jgi:DNA-binding winged helix-turn-helix (wHTH) protein
MRSCNSNRRTGDGAGSAFVGTDSIAPEPRSTYSVISSIRPGQHRNFFPSKRMPPALRNGAAELLADIDGLPVLFRFLVQDVPPQMPSDFVSKDADMSSALEKMVDRMGGSPLRRDDPSKQPLAIVELISSGEALDPPPAPLNQTMLRVGPLELDLLDRTAKRSDRRIDLRPREFRLLKYMMQRSDRFLTRATLLKEVWHYKFVPKTNLVDVHMGRLRRKVDGPNEAPMIHNARGVGFILRATPRPRASSSRPSERSGNPVVV